MKTAGQPPVTREHARVRDVADHLEKWLIKAYASKSSAPDPEFQWLVKALRSIGEGADANIALGVKWTKGHDKKKAEVHFKTQHAIAWIAEMMHSENGLPPPTKTVAIQLAAEIWGLNPDSLRRACPSIKKLKDLVHFRWDDLRPALAKKP